MKLGTLTVALGDLPLDKACGFLAENGVQLGAGVSGFFWCHSDPPGDSGAALEPPLSVRGGGQKKPW